MTFIHWLGLAFWLCLIRLKSSVEEWGVLYIRKREREVESEGESERKRERERQSTQLGFRTNRKDSNIKDISVISLQHKYKTFEAFVTYLVRLQLIFVDSIWEVSTKCWVANEWRVFKESEARNDSVLVNVLQIKCASKSFLDGYYNL